MEFDKHKVDDATLALLWLVIEKTRTVRTHGRASIGIRWIDCTKKAT